MRILGCLFSLLSLSALAQDSLFLLKGTKEAVVLLEVNPDDLRYKRFDNQSGPTYTILKKEVASVKYKNGKKEFFSQEVVAEKPKENVITSPKDTVAPNKPKEEGIFAGDIPDTLFFKSGKRTEAKVLIVGASEVRYKLFTYQDGPTYNAAKFELKSIHYGRGSVENFNESAASQDPVVTNPSNNNSNNQPKTEPKKEPELDPNPYATHYGGVDMYQKGQADAVKHYKHNGGSIGVGCAGAGCGLFGLIPAIIVANKPPKEFHLAMPRNNYSGDPQYQKGYKDQAHKMKRKRVWRGYTIGATIGIALAVLAASS